MEQKEYKAICLHFNGKTEADQPALQGQECQHRYLSLPAEEGLTMNCRRESSCDDS